MDEWLEMHLSAAYVRMQHTFYTHNRVGKVCTCTTAKHHLKPNLAFGVYDFRIQCENHNKCVFECRGCHRNLITICWLATFCKQK